MSSSALALPSARVELRSDFRGEGLCFVPRQKAFLKVYKMRRLEATGLDSFEHCERSGFRVNTPQITFHRLQRCGQRVESFVVNALPLEAVSAAATVMVVGASVGALIWLNQDKLSAAISEKAKCEACNGSGLCTSCNGEGFQLKDLSADAAARARANAKDAATRYTAGLAKKWSYCPNCSGSRNCPACDGRGSLNITQTES